MFSSTTQPKLVLRVALIVALLGMFVTSLPITRASESNFTLEVTGKVIAKGADNFTLQSSLESRFIKVTTATQILKNGLPATFNDLNVDMVIFAKIKPITNAAPGTPNWEAIGINLTPPPPPTPTLSWEGKVTDKGADFFTLQSEGTTQTRRVNVISATLFYQDGQPATFDSLQIGVEVETSVKVSPTSADALAVKWKSALNARAEYWSGLVTEKGADYFNLTNKSGTVQHVLVTTSTIYMENEQPTTFSILETGIMVQTKVQIVSNTVTALGVSWKTRSETWRGVVTEKGADFIKLSSGNPTVTRSISLTANTLYFADGQPSALDSLTVGKFAEVMVTLKGSAVATKISWQADGSRIENWRGIVVAKGTDSLTLKVGTTNQTIKVTNTTTFMKNGQEVAFSAITVGMAVEVQVKITPNTLTEALKVSVVNRARR